MADNIRSDNIDDIVSGVREALKSGENLEGGVRFEFVEDEDDTMLVFEDGDSEEPAEEEPKTEASEPVAAFEPVAEAKKESTEKESRPQDKIWTTYVPRFTSASDSYRMKTSENPAFAAAREEKKEEMGAPITVADSHSAEIDPTAELDSEESVAGATVVSSGNTVSDTADISKVFKFESSEAQVSEPVTEEEVARQIDELFSLAVEQSEEVGESEPDSELDSVSEEPEESEERVTEELESEKESLLVPAPVSASERIALPTQKTAIAVESVDESVGKKKNREYTALSEKDGFIDSFIDSITSIKVRVFAAAFLAILLLLIENASFFGVNVTKFLHLEGVGGGMAIVTFPFVLGLFLLSLPEVAYSFASLTVGKLVPEIFITVSFFVMSVYYGIVIAFASGNDYFLLGFVFAAMVIFTMLSSHYKKKADFSAFKIISGKGEKQVVDRKLTRNLPAEHRALDGMVESYKSRCARVFKTSFVSDFSARSSVISENSKANLLILAISLGIALVGGAFAFFIPGGIVSAIKTFALVYTLALPSFIFISHKIPYAQATASAYEEGSAFIGEKSLFDYSGIDVITFDDTEIFTKDDVNLQRIMVYGRKENLPKAVAQMSALFTVIGGPLAYIFADAADRRVSPADNVAVDTDGIVGEIDGVEIMAGNAAFMQRHGVEIPFDPNGEGTPSQTTRIMYAAEGGEIYAKFYIRYMLSEDFTMILPILLDDKIKPLVYTRDPNIDNSLFRSLTAGTDSIRVLKKQNLPSSEVRLYSRISLGMASVGDKTNIINSILLSKRYSALHTKLSVMELPVAIGGAILGLLLSLLVKSPIPSLILSLWYIGWSVGVIISGRAAFTRKKDKNKDKD